MDLESSSSAQGVVSLPGPSTDLNKSLVHCRPFTLEEALAEMTDDDQEQLLQSFEKQYDKLLKEHKVITQIQRKVMNMPE
jgi:tyrosine-protein phosphatase YwqE